jgi:hypothetical protein
MKKLTAVAVLASVALFAHATALFCKEDGTLLTWTGNHKFENKMLYEYKCMGGHVFWLEPFN